MSNRQLKMTTELVLQASKDDPNVEWDDLLNRLMAMCQFRGMTITWNSRSQGDNQDLVGLAARVGREHVPATAPRDNGSVRMESSKKKGDVHPLFRDEPKSGSGAA